MNIDNRQLFQHYLLIKNIKKTDNGQNKNVTFKLLESFTLENCVLNTRDKETFDVFTTL